MQQTDQTDVKSVTRRYITISFLNQYKVYWKTENNTHIIVNGCYVLLYAKHEIHKEMKNIPNTIPLNLLFQSV